MVLLRVLRVFVDLSLSEGGFFNVLARCHKSRGTVPCTTLLCKNYIRVVYTVMDYERPAEASFLVGA